MNHIHSFPFEKLQAYHVAREVLRRVVALTRDWPRGWSDLRDHARRSSSSSVLNTAEGACHPRGSGDKARHFVIALGSAGEVAACLDVAAEHELSPRDELLVVMQLNRQAAALIGGLIRSQKR